MATDQTEAARAQKDYAALCARIRARSDLSDQGRKAHLARAFTEHQDQMKALRAAQAAEDEQRRNDLVRSIFGNTGHRSGADLLSQRDAFARADAITTPAEAAATLRLARMSGDVELARAVSARAYDRAVGSMGGTREAWGGVVDDWARDTGNTERVDQLLEIDGLGATQSQAMTERVLGMMRTSAPRPAELDDVADLHDAARNADSADYGDLTPTARKAASDNDITFRHAAGRLPEVG